MINPIQDALELYRCSITRTWVNKLKEDFQVYAKGWIHEEESLGPKLESLGRGRLSHLHLWEESPLACPTTRENLATKESSSGRILRYLNLYKHGKPIKSFLSVQIILSKPKGFLKLRDSLDSITWRISFSPLRNFL